MPWPEKSPATSLGRRSDDERGGPLPPPQVLLPSTPPLLGIPPPRKYRMRGGEPALGGSYGGGLRPYADNAHSGLRLRSGLRSPLRPPVAASGLRRHPGSSVIGSGTPALPFRPGIVGTRASLTSKQKRPARRNRCRTIRGISGADIVSARNKTTTLPPPADCEIASDNFAD